MYRSLSLFRRQALAACFALSVALVLFGPSLSAQDSRLSIESESVEPFQIFDNVYYIGTGWVSCYAIDTGDGLVLIDALYGGFPELALKHFTGIP